MNEAHFKLFILYVLDLHNLQIERRVDILANPLNKQRKVEIEKLNENLALKGFSLLNLESQNNSSSGVTRKAVVRVQSEVTSEDKVDDEGYTTLESGEFSCNYCSATFKRMGNTRNHLNSKHQMTINSKCSCGKNFSESTKLNRHQKTCKAMK